MINPKKQSVKHISMHKRSVAKAGAEVLHKGSVISYHTIADNETNDCRSTFNTISKSSHIQRLIMNAALDAIICINLEGNITFWNPQAEVIFGWKQEDAIGQKLSSLIIPELYRKRHDDGMAAYLKTGKGPALNKLLELSALHCNGKEFPIELTIMPIMEDGVEFFCAFIRDITEKKSIEKKLKLSESRLKEAQEVAKVGSWETDLLTLQVIWSEETYRIFEIDASEFQESHPGFLDFVHPDDRKKVDTAFVNSLGGNSVNTVEHRILTKSGHIKYVAERWKIYYNENNQPVRAVGTCQDITEQKLAEIRTTESEFKYRSLIEQATDAICIADASMRIIEINPSGCQMLGYTKEEFLNLTITDLFVSDDLISNPFKLDELQSRKVISNERRLKRKDGTLIELELNVKILEDGRFVLFARDITKRKQTEKALQAAYEEKNIILESIDDGFFAVDNNSLVTYWNRKAELLLGEKREDIIGRNIHEMFASPDSNDFYENYQKAIREKTTVHFEAFSKRSGKWFSVSAFASETGLSVHFKDVSERVAFEEKVHESEIRYRSLVEQASDTICIADENMKFVEVNPSGCQMFGYSKNEFLDLHINDVLFIEDLKTNPIQFGILKAGKTTSNERRIKRKDGSAIEIELNAKMLEDGKILIFGRDITDRKKADRKLKESNERYNLISQATNDMVWDWDLATGKVFRNKEGWRKIFRSAEDKICEAITNAWDSRIHPDDKENVARLNKSIHNSTSNSFEVECRVLRDDGTYAYIHDRGNIIRDELGKPVRVIGASQDITQRKEAEIQVAKSELRFRSLVQNSSDLISILDVRGYYLYSSPTVKKVLGYEPEFLVGKNAFSFIHPEDIATIKSHLSKMGNSNYMEIIPFRFKNAKGEWRWLESKVTDMTGNPEVAGYVFNSRDVTERKIAEEEIKKLSIIASETINAVIITDPQEKILWVNEAFTRITEFEAEDVIGKRPGDFLQGEDTDPAVVRFMRSKIKKVEAFECDILNYSKYGRKYWLRIQCQPQFDEAGKLKYFFAIETDITKEKEAEEILKASEERYRYLFNNNPACICIWDIETLKILEVNNTAKYLYGYTKEEFLNLTILDFSYEKYHQKIKQFAVDADRQPDFRSENICKHYNNAGEVMYMNISSHRIQFRGRNVILALANNITDKVILEKELEKERLFKQQEITQAVISAQEQERQELGGELHDNINQILAGSLLYLGLAKRELKIDHQYLTETDILINTAITEIRNLSHTLIPPSLHESELLGAIKNIIDVTQKTSDINITLQAYGFDESLVEDKLKLSIYRIVQEQFNNVLKHAAAKKIIVRLVQDKEKTMLSIKDDGIGFDTSQKANGVGLMNIKTRASLFNGEINIISSPGNGCELRVLFN